MVRWTDVRSEMLTSSTFLSVRDKSTSFFENDATDAAPPVSAISLTVMYASFALLQSSGWFGSGGGRLDSKNVVLIMS